MIVKQLCQKKAQLTVEYAVMFAALVIVVLLASSKIMQPTMTNKYFNGIGNLVEGATTELQERAKVSKIAFGNASTASTPGGDTPGGGAPGDGGDSYW